MTKVIIYGAGGRMGQSNFRSAFNDDQIEIVAAIEAPNSPFIGQDAGILSGCGSLNIIISDNLKEALPKTDCVIDFTTPVSTLQALEINKEFKKNFVIGSTGLTDQDKEQLQNYSKEFPVVFAPNFSIGMNVLLKVTELAGSLLNKENGYDLEIIEAHHRFKKDAPSGTALRLGEVAAEASGRNFSKSAIYGRQGITGERSIDEMGMLTMRAGDIIGDHKVVFCTLGERVELGHIAHTRETFSKGVVLASKWIKDKSPGLYDMKDVLGL